MTQGKRWTGNEEKCLKIWVEKGLSLEELSRNLNREPDAIRMKLNRMGLKVVVQKKIKKQSTTTTTVLPKDIITHEQALRVLAGALEALRQPGLSKPEIQRLRILIRAVKIYDSVLEKFEGWVQIENRLVEMDKKITEFEKAKNVSFSLSRA